VLTSVVIGCKNESRSSLGRLRLSCVDKSVESCIFFFVEWRQQLPQGLKGGHCLAAKRINRAKFFTISAFLTYLNPFLLIYTAFSANFWCFLSKVSVAQWLERWLGNPSHPGSSLRGGKTFFAFFSVFLSFVIPSRNFLQQFHAIILLILFCAKIFQANGDIARTVGVFSVSQFFPALIVTPTLILALLAIVDIRNSTNDFLNDLLLAGGLESNPGPDEVALEEMESTQQRKLSKCSGHVLSISTLNCRGLTVQSKARNTIKALQDLYKRKKVSHYIAMLQETHLFDENFLSQTLDCQVIAAHGTSQSRGVAVVISSELTILPNSICKDNEGRFIILAVSGYNPSKPRSPFVVNYSFVGS
jgi:hypothetical protein